MNNRFQKFLRRLAEKTLQLLRYRVLRAHVWDDAVRELDCGDCA